MRWTRNYATGLIFIVLVALIWAASSVLIQYIYDSGDNHFRSPFMVTYIGVSLFTLYIPTQKLIACMISMKMKAGRHSGRQQQASQQQAGSDLSRVPYQTVPFEQSNSDDDEQEDESDGAIRQPPHTSPQNDGLHSIGVDQQDDFVHSEFPGVQPWTETDHLRAAVYIAPIWFLANWTYNASLVYTSITSSTVLASTGSLFTFLFAVITADEHFNCTKLAGVLLGVSGSILTAMHDSSHPDNDDGSATSNIQRRFLTSQCHEGDCLAAPPLLGDVLGLLSAVGYGTYAVQTRVFCPKNESLYSMQTLLGYIGLLNLVVLSPIAIYQLLSGKTELAWIVLGFLVVKGLFDNVLSDYLWLRAVMLTNATTATVGLGLTIPLAFASDVVLGKADVMTAEQVLGAFAVLVGFVLVNIGNDDDDDAADETESTTSAVSHHPPFGEDSQRGQEVVNLQGRTIA
jgi:solute carrier family 35 protein F5